MIASIREAARSAPGPLAALAAVIVGIELADRATPSAGLTPIVLGVGALAAGWRLGRGRRRRVAVALLLLGTIALAAAADLRAHHGLVDSSFNAFAFHRVDGTLTGTLVDDPTSEQFGAHALVRVTDFRSADGRVASHRTVLVRASADVAMRLRLVAAGDAITATGTIEPLDGYDARYANQHAAVRFRLRSITNLRPSTNPLFRVANGARTAVLDADRAFAPEDRALFASFLLGDTRGLSPQLVTDFRNAGLSHLLVVSGANVAFVLAVFAPLLRRSPRVARFLLILAIVILFGTMTRWEPSVTRAVVMTALATTATLLGRGAHAVRVLALTVLLLLVVDPFLLHSVSFGLSVGASAGISLFAKPIAARLPGPRFVRETLGVTAAAQIGVLPIILGVFGSIPLVTLPANLLAVPVAEPLTIVGIVGVAIGRILGPIVPSVQPVALLPATLGLRWVILVARTGARYPVLIDTRAAWGIGAIAAALRALDLRRRAAGRRARSGDGRPA